MYCSQKTEYNMFLLCYFIPLRDKQNTPIIKYLIPECKNANGIIVNVKSRHQLDDEQIQTEHSTAAPD